MRRPPPSIVCLLASLVVVGCGDAAGTSASATTSPTGPQPTSVSEASIGASSSSGEPDATSTSGQVPTTGEPTTTAATTTTGASTGASSDDSGPGDPSASETGFDPTDCVTALQATIRDFKVMHPDFEDFTSETGLKGLVEAALGPDMKPVYAANGPTAQTAGPEPFAQWYNNTPDTNIAFAIDIPLTQVEPGLYSYENHAFFPIDGEGWGNEDQPHNFHFTTEIHTIFDYQGGEQFTFIGDDDLWLFINGKLAIDLGGVHPELSATVDLDAEADALGISIGGTYSMDIFHAERHTVDSNFRIDTSIQCFLIPG